MKIIDNPFELAPEILKRITDGAILNVKKGDSINSMVIGWASLGCEWSKPILTVFIKTSRYSHELLDKEGEFSLNIPYPNPDEQLVMLLGRNSGRIMDKLAKSGLQLLKPMKITTPALDIPSIVIECQVIYRQDQVLDELRDNNLRERYYPKGDIKEDNPHTCYEALIKTIYINE